MVVCIYDKLHVQWSIQLLMPISNPLDRWIATDEEPREDNQDDKEGCPVPMTCIKEQEVGSSTWEIRTAKAVARDLGLLSS